MKAGSYFATCALVVMASLCGNAFSQQAGDELAAARSLINNGKVAESEAILHGAIAKNPNWADAYFLLGYAYFRERKPRKSLAAFTSGARFRRPAADDLRVVASDYVLLGDFPDAQKWFQEVTLEKPGDADAWYLLGRSQYNQDEFKDAISSFEQALKLRPRYLEAENNLGLCWQGLNRVDDAMAAFHNAISWQEEKPADPQPYLNLGSLLADQGHPDQALSFLKRASQLAPENPRIHEVLAQALEATHHVSEAQHELEEAVALAPKASGPHFKLGRLYQREGLRSLAQEQFAICQKLDSTHSSTDTPNPYQPKSHKPL